VDAGLRAAADRIWYDTASLIYIASLVDDALLERRCAATGWTAGETIAHIADTLERCGETLERVISGEAPGATAGTDADRSRKNASTSLASVLSRLRRGRDRAMCAIADLPREPGLLIAGGQPVAEFVRDQAEHCGAHSLDFLEAVPELGQEVMVLNWALHQQPEDNPSWAARRTAIIDDVRKWLAQQDNGKD
jgi:hypothetical protein